MKPKIYKLVEQLTYLQKFCHLSDLSVFMKQAPHTIYFFNNRILKKPGVDEHSKENLVFIHSHSRVVTAF